MASCLLDDEGRVYVVSDIGVGLVHTLDRQFNDALTGIWTILIGPVDRLQMTGFIYLYVRLARTVYRDNGLSGKA